MTDFSKRFRALDELRTPDQWREIEERAVALPQLGPRPLFWAVLVAISILALTVAGAALVGSDLIKLPPPLPVPPDASEHSAPPNTPVEGSWTATGSMLNPLDGTPVLLEDGRVLVAGSYQAPAVPFAELYDPDTGSWTSSGDMTEARRGHTATLLPDGMVLVAGGSNGETGLASAELYDPRTGSWTETGSMHERRTYHRATLLPNGTVLVSGGLVLPAAGVDGGGGLWSWADGDIWGSAEIYDPRTGSWTETGSMKDSRANHSATLLPDGTVLVAGGEHLEVSVLSFLVSAEIYDPHTGSWTETGSMLRRPADYHAATLLPDGTVLVTQGNSAEVYDPGSGSWAATGDLGYTQYGAAAALLADGTVLLAGGADCNGDPCFTSRAQLFDPATGSWTETGSLLGVRKFHHAIVLRNGTVLVFGGTDGHHPGSSWHRLTTTELYHPVAGN